MAVNYKQRQAYMRSLGYKVPLDGSWGPYQQKIWDRLSTKNKEYDTTVMGLVQGLADKITGNNTYKKDPLEQSQIYTSRKDSYTKPSNGVSKAIFGTWLPILGAATLPSTILKHPVATLVGSVGGKVGSKLVDKTSKALTGQDYSTNVGNVLGISKEAAEYTNPGIYAGGYGAIRRLLNSIYTNITPLGYANMNTVRGIPITKLTKSQELANAVKDFFIPKPINTNDPKWIKNINPKANISSDMITFRDDAWRLATRQKPRTISINGKQQSLYIPNGDGTYRYNMDYVNHVKQNAGVSEGNKLYVFDNAPNIAHDNITSNAGFMGIKYTPQYKQNISIKGNSAVSYGKPKVTIEDKWDLQPFKDNKEQRSLLPWLSEKAAQNPKNMFYNYLRNFEALDAVGGNAFQLKQTLPAGTAEIIKLNTDLK